MFMPKYLNNQSTKRVVLKNHTMVHTTRTLRPMEKHTTATACQNICMSLLMYLEAGHVLKANSAKQQHIYIVVYMLMNKRVRHDIHIYIYISS
jgi:hypothetical protein